MIEANGGLTVTLWPAYWPHQKCCSDQAPLWGLTRPRKPTGWNFNIYTKNICRRSSVIKIYFRSVVCRIKVIIFFTVWGCSARRMPEKQFWSWRILSSDQGWVPTETQDMFWSWAGNSFASEVVSAQQSSQQTTGHLIISSLTWGHDILSICTGWAIHWDTQLCSLSCGAAQAGCSQHHLLVQEHPGGAAEGGVQADEGGRGHAQTLLSLGNDQVGSCLIWSWS